METTNQEIKFFSVEIGTETRRGNFIKHHSFVCKTQLDTMDIHKHYREKYSGFALNVESIKEVIILDEKVESKKIELTSKRVTTFSGVMEFDKFRKDTRDKLIELNESRIEHNVLKDSVEQMVKKEIKERSGLIESVTLNNSIPDKFNGRTFVKLPYKANLNGNVIEHTEREIQEEE